MYKSMYQAILCTLITLLVACFLVSPASAVLVSNPCINGDTDDEADGRLNFCALENKVEFGPQGGVGVTTAQSFLLTISPANINTSQIIQGTTVGDIDSLNNALKTGPIPGNPTTTIDRFVRLDGRVRLLDENAVVKLRLEGHIDGTLDVATDTIIFDTGNCPQNTDCNVLAFGTVSQEKTANFFEEYLFWEITGRAIYTVGSSPTYAGIPEPGSLGLLGVGYAALLGWRANRRRRRGTAS